MSTKKKKKTAFLQRRECGIAGLFLSCTNTN